VVLLEVVAVVAVAVAVLALLILLPGVNITILWITEQVMIIRFKTLA
jgi:hypothetical protein